MSSAESLLPFSQFANEVSQPSSLMRAVSSETLSVGAYDSKWAILRKSLTACPALPALPPTPRMNSRPPLSRTFTISSMIRFTTAVSMPAATCCTSWK